MNPDLDSPRPQSRSAFVSAGYFLLPLNGPRDPARPWSRAGRWLGAWGLLTGIIYAVVFSVAWRWLGEYQHVRIAPMAFLLVIDLGFFGHRLLAGFTGLFAGPVSRTQPAEPIPAIATQTVIILLAILKYALLLSLPVGAVTWPADWRQYLGPGYPYVVYRPLILMPLWGRWAVQLAAIIGPPSASGSRAFQDLACGLSLRRVMLNWAGAAGLTILYCSPSLSHLAWPVMMSLGLLVAAYLVSFVLVRRDRGQTETTVLACGLACEYLFLLAYLPVARFIYWY